MTASDPSVRLKAISDASSSVSKLIARLAKVATADAPAEEPDARTELSAEIHQTLKELDEEFELAKQEAEDLIGAGGWTATSRRGTSERDRDRDRVSVVTQVERVGDELKLYAGDPTYTSSIAAGN